MTKFNIYDFLWEVDVQNAKQEEQIQAPVEDVVMGDPSQQIPQQGQEQPPTAAPQEQKPALQVLDDQGSFDELKSRQIEKIEASGTPTEGAITIHTVGGSHKGTTISWNKGVITLTKDDGTPIVLTQGG